jgi:hypothetical protein
MLASLDSSFRQEIADCFPEAVWVPLPSHLSLSWLSDWRARDDGETERPQDAAGLHRLADPGPRR